MKKLIFAIIAAMMLSASVLADDISVEVNGVKIQSDVAPVIVNDRTLVPVRAISEALNCDIAWDDETKGVYIFKNNFLYTMWLEHNTAFKISPVGLENYYDMDTPPVIINDRAMLPLRALGELLGADVNWISDTKTASVSLAVTEEEYSIYAEQLIAYEQEMKKMYTSYDNYVHNKGNIINAKITLETNEVIELELYPEIAPISVENFVQLANDGFYDGLIFHRVIQNFMIQGGAYTENDEYKQSQNIYGEFIDNGYFNLIKHTEGIISMARANHPDSASSQFFIMHKDTPQLDGQYAAFGKVTKGMEVVDSIAQSDTDSDDKPLKDIIIKSITIIE